MALDIYGRAGNNFAGAISADGAQVTFAGGSSASETDIGLIMQQIMMAYAQTISRIFEIGTNNTYYVAGRAQGESQVGHVVGPRAVQFGFYTKYGNVCNAAGNILVFGASAACVGGDVPRNQSQQPGGTFRFIMRHPVIRNLTISIQNPQDMVINQQLGLLFVSLELDANTTRT